MEQQIESNNQNAISNNQNSISNDLIIVGIKKILKDLFNMLGNVGLTIYYTYSYFEIDLQFRNTVLLNCLLIIIILGWISILNTIMYMINIIKFYNITINQYVLDILLIRYQITYRIIYLLHFIGFSVQLYIMGRIVPFVECSSYSDFHGYQNACISMKSISCLTIIGLCVMGIICYMIYIVMSKNKNNSYAKHLDKLKAIVYQIIPIKLHDTQCAICIRSFELNKPIASVLNCNHKYHESCLNEWMKYQTHCTQCSTILVKESI